MYILFSLYTFLSLFHPLLLSSPGLFPLPSLIPSPRIYIVHTFSPSHNKKLKVEEVTDFSQSDLSQDDVMILDAYNEVYVWIGDHANDLEKRMAMETAMVRKKGVGGGEKRGE